jgi:hypothetical protein
MSIQTKAHALLCNHHQMIKNREPSMLLRTVEEMGLDVDVTRYHSYIQGKTPSNFSQAYDRARVTMS